MYLKKLFCFSFKFNENWCVLKFHQVSMDGGEFGPKQYYKYIVVFFLRTFGGIRAILTTHNKFWDII